MLPQQPLVPNPEKPSSDPYDFIRQSGRPQSSSPLSSNTSSTSRIAIVASGAAVLIILAIVFIKVLSAPSDPTVALLTRLAQQQTELARVAAEPAQGTAAQPTLNFAMTTSLTLQSDQQSLLGMLASAGKTPDPAVLSATQNATTDTTLTTAKANGNYDTTFVNIAQNQLTTYQQTLTQTFKAAKSSKEKQWLTDAYNHAQLLMQMSNQTE